MTMMGTALRTEKPGRGADHPVTTTAAAATTSPYSSTWWKISGAISALNAPPRTPPSAVHKKNPVRYWLAGRDCASRPWKASPALASIASVRTIDTRLSGNQRNATAVAAAHPRKLTSITVIASRRAPKAMMYVAR